MIKKVKNIFSSGTNQKILNYLGQIPYFIATDELPQGRIKEAFREKNRGFSNTTYNEKEGVKLDTPLNLYAEIVFDRVVNELNIKEASIFRIFWNMYFKNSETAWHKDDETEDQNMFSILYCIHNNGGGIYIEDKFYQDVAGEAKVFSSGLTHKGGPPVNENARFSLNIMFRRIK